VGREFLADGDKVDGDTCWRVRLAVGTVGEGLGGVWACLGAGAKCHQGRI
jgi:hypothetical protein